MTVRRPIASKGIAVERIIADIEGSGDGPTLVIVVGIHGNEEGGVIAALHLIEGLRRDGLHFHGRLIVLAGNLAALGKGIRHIDRDLNRIWSDGTRGNLDASISEMQDLRELRAVIATLEDECNEPLTILDLHSFSGKGLPFVIAPGENSPSGLLKNMPFPVIHGLNDYILGTFCTYLEERGHGTLVMEGGRDGDPEVPLNMEAFLWHAMVELGMLDLHMIPRSANKTWRSLLEEESELPRHLHVFHRHAIDRDDGFVMRPGFRTFDHVKKGDHLADDTHGPILCPDDGYLLMPLYQKQGEDGFFLGRAWNMDIA